MRRISTLFGVLTALTLGSLAWQRLYRQALLTIDREKQRDLLRQMERHTHDQAYALFLYNPIQLAAVSKTVTYVPYRAGNLLFAETAVTDQHRSIRKGNGKK